MFDRRRFLKSAALLGGAVVLGRLGGTMAVGQSSAQFTTTRYTWIDHDQGTAKMYDENLKELDRFRNRPSVGAETIPEDRWLVGMDIDVVKKNLKGELEVVTDKPEYAQMVHHDVSAVTGKDTLSSGCGLTSAIPAQFVAGTGSELTGWRMPPGYGYRVKAGSIRFNATWHWVNPPAPEGADRSKAHIPGEYEYVRYILSWDKAPSGYIDTNVFALNALACSAEFCVPPGRSTQSTLPYKAQNEVRVILTYPHVHKHVEKIELVQNDKVVYTWKPASANTPAEHDPCSGNGVEWHAAEGHLPPRGIVAWAPGASGPVLKPGDQLLMTAYFNNPHPIAIDEMLLCPVFVETLKS